MFSLTMCSMSTCQFAALAPPKSYSLASKPATTSWSKIENSDFSADFPVRKEHGYLLIGRSNVDVWSGRSPKLQFVLITGYTPDTAGGANMEGLAINEFEKTLLADSCSYYDRSLLPERSKLRRLSDEELEGTGWQGRVITFGEDDKESATLVVARETWRQTPYYAALITGSKANADVDYFIKALTIKHLPDEAFASKKGH